MGTWMVTDSGTLSIYAGAINQFFNGCAGFHAFSGSWMANP
jgi:hypothetical protein